MEDFLPYHHKNDIQIYDEELDSEDPGSIYFALLGIFKTITGYYQKKKQNKIKTITEY